MRKQRPRELPVAIDATAEHLPFSDGAFDASMTTFSVHQWPDLERGLLEMRRVTGGPVLVLTCDPAALHHFWLNEYAPEVITVEARRYPPISTIASLLGPGTRIEHVNIPLDCTDGFRAARPGPVFP
jgi:ubiquinone/menaquinone biosynthesis C-methylase UbiE